MGGADKGLVDHAGRPLVHHVIERLVPQVDDLMISANRNLERYRELCPQVVSDVFIDPEDAFPGPLAGLHAGLTHACHERVLCVPCDAPELPIDLCQRLAQALDAAPQARVAVARCEGSLQPTFCLLDRKILPELDAALRRGLRKLGAWQQEAGAQLVDFDDMNAFLNMNTLHRTATPDGRMGLC